MKDKKLNQQAINLQAELDKTPNKLISMRDTTGAVYFCVSMSQALRNIESLQKSLGIELLPMGWQQMNTTYVFAHACCNPAICKKFKIEIYSEVFKNKTKIK